MNESKQASLSIRGLTMVDAQVQIDDQVHSEICEQEQHSELRIKSGSITVLMGSNGVGKTRLMEIAAGLIPAPDEQQIRFSQEQLWTRNAFGRQRRNRNALLAYSYACQTPEDQLFARSVDGELHFAMKPYRLSALEQEQRKKEALHAVGWDSSWLSRNPYRMSGGERRRTALACLFAVPAAWLLLDEPTAGLDAAGHAILGTELKKCASSGQGVLLISHESDWALSIADHIVMMQMDGRIRSCSKEQLLEHPEWMQQAGMTVPAWLQIAHELWSKGIPAQQVWNPEALAVAIASQRQEAIKDKPVRIQEMTERTNRIVEFIHADRKPDFQKRAEAVSQSPLVTFDPRAVWLSYLLLSTFMFLQRSWSGIFFIALLTIGIIILGRINLKRWKGPIRSFSVFTLIIAIFAGFTSPEKGSLWSLPDFLISIRSLSKPWFVMLIGLGLPIVITPLRLRRSLEQLLNKRGYISPLGMKMILTVTLLIRFVPVLLTEWERFSRFAIARGKMARFTLRGTLTSIHDITVPFMLSLFRLADNVANALESRGVSMLRQPTFMKSIYWGSRDTILIIVSVVICILLWCWNFLHTG